MMPPRPPPPLSSPSAILFGTTLTRVNNTINYNSNNNDTSRDTLYDTPDENLLSIL